MTTIELGAKATSATLESCPKRKSDVRPSSMTCLVVKSLFGKNRFMSLDNCK